MTGPRRLARALLCLLVLLVAPAAVAQEAAAPPPAVEPASPEEIEKLLRTLEDPAQRAALTAQLRALLEAQKAAQPEAAPETLGTRVLNALSDGVQGVSQQVASAGRALVDAPQGLAWLRRQALEPALRDTWLRLGFELVVVVVAGYTARLAMLWLLRRPRAALATRPVTSLLAKLPLLLMKTLIDVLPIAAFALAGYAVLSVTDPQRAVRLAAIGFLNASILVQAVMLAARALLSPDSPNLRLLRVSDETAHYLAIWVRRIAFTAVYGYFLAQVALLLGLPPRPYEGALKLVGLVVAAMLVIVVLQNRHPVADWLRGAAPAPTGPDPNDTALAAAMGGSLHPDTAAADAPGAASAGGEVAGREPPSARDPGRAMSAARRRLADIWHVLAILYIVVIFGIWALDIAGGFQFVLRATLVTILALALGRLLSAGVDRVIQRGFAVAPALRDQFPGLEGRANRYLPVLKQALKAVVWLIVAIIVLQAWGFDTFDWLASGTGQRVSASLVSIAVVMVLAVVAWELVSGAIERYLTAKDAAGQAVERSARVRTLLPLLRNAFLIFLLAVVSLIVLSEIGVNIAPLLAGAGVIGLAVGFGSQTLVKDVITGLFILFEDTISVGDVVDVGGQGGVVESISIRTLKLRDMAGTVHVIPFSEVTRISNLTKDFSFYVFDVGIAYREDVDRVIGVLKALGEEMQKDPAFAPLILEPLEVLGVDAFLDSAVVIKARFKTRPVKQWTVGREFNRRMKRRFDELGIEIPFPHQTIYFGVDQRGRAPAAHVQLDAPDLARTLEAASRIDAPAEPAPEGQGRKGRRDAGPEDFTTPDRRGDSAARSSTGDDAAEPDTTQPR